MLTAKEEVLNAYHKYLKESDSHYEEELQNLSVSDLEKACMRAGFVAGYIEGKVFAFKSIYEKVDNLLSRNEDDGK